MVATLFIVWFVSGCTVAYALARTNPPQYF